MLKRINVEELIEMINNEHHLYGRDYFLMHGDFLLDGSLIKERSSFGNKVTSLQLNRLVITGMLHIEKFNGSLLQIGECNILEGVHLSRCRAASYNINSSELQSLDFGYDCKGERCFIRDLRTDGLINLAGLNLSEKLNINKVSFKEVTLASDVSRIVVPEVRTNDLIIAKQFERLRIPVISSTEAVRRESALQTT